MPPDSTTPKAADAHVFHTTRWSVVLAAGQAGSPQSFEALTQLCRTYWYPVYSYVRRRGHGPDDAKDLTQEFYARLIEKNWLADIEPDRGKFRCLLLTILRRFLANEYDRSQAIRRGGGVTIVSLDADEAEDRFTHEPATNDTAERNFDRRWALAALDQAMSQLQGETSQAGKAKQFAHLSPFLSREPEPGEYALVGQSMGLSQGAVGVAVHRLRQRYRELVRAQVAATVDLPDRVEEELRHLLAALREG